MKHKKEDVKKNEGKGEKVTYTCVCNMEWRGTHGDEWGDCVCYSDKQEEVER